MVTGTATGSGDVGVEDHPHDTGNTDRMIRHTDTGTPESEWQADSRLATLRTLDFDGLPAGRVLVLSAHPDDESLGAAGLLHRLCRLGRLVHVVVSTAGEGSHPQSPTHPPERLGARRLGELRGALDEIDPAIELTCLHLPDGGLAEREDDIVEQVLSLSRGWASRPGVVLSPWSGDGHPDHEAAGRAAGRVAEGLGALHLEFPIWLWHWGSADDAPWESMVRHDLDQDAVTAKRRAITRHTSQVEPLSAQPGDETLLPPNLLAHFERTHETFIASSTETAQDAPDPSVFEQLHSDSADPWGVDSRWYERRKRDITLASLTRERYRRGIEVGCSVGALLAELAGRCDELVGVDVSEAALSAAAQRIESLPDDRSEGVRFEQRRVPDDWPEGDFDLIVLSEVGYFLDVASLDRLLDRCLESLSPTGELVLVNWRHPVEGWPLDGDDVRERASRRGDLVTTATHVETDFALDLLTRPGLPSVAEREGLL
ncbi:PIG-L family deacetylase [Actinomycetota bacterium]